jgi:hypothetical protein
MKMFAAKSVLFPCTSGYALHYIYIIGNIVLSDYPK